MGAPAKEDRQKDITELFNWGFASFSSVQLSADSPIMPVKVEMGVKDEVLCELESSSPVLIKKAEASSMVKTVYTEESVKAPVKKGMPLGSLTVTCGENTIAVIPIVASEDVDRLELGMIFRRIFSMVCMRESSL